MYIKLYSILYTLDIPGTKVFINVLRGKTEIIPESILVVNPSYRFSSENNVFILASTNYPTVRSDEGAYVVFDVIVADITLKAVDMKAEYSEIVFKAILEYISATFSISFSTDLSFPKIKGMYKRSSDSSSPILEQVLVPEYSGIGTKALSTLEDITDWLEAFSQQPEAGRTSLDGVLYKLSNNKLLGKHWVKHEFTITDGILDYYNKSKKKGNLNLKGCIVAPADDGEYLEPIGSCPFVVQSREAKDGVPVWELILATKEGAERDEWIDVIRECSGRRLSSSSSFNGGTYL
jgi:hypothetical protein